MSYINNVENIVRNIASSHEEDYDEAYACLRGLDYLFSECSYNNPKLIFDVYEKLTLRRRWNFWSHLVGYESRAFDFGFSFEYKKLVKLIHNTIEYRVFWVGVYILSFAIWSLITILAYDLHPGIALALTCFTIAFDITNPQEIDLIIKQNDLLIRHMMLSKTADFGISEELYEKQNCLHEKAKEELIKMEWLKKDGNRN